MVKSNNKKHQNEEEEGKKGKPLSITQTKKSGNIFYRELMLKN
jgi:hypothetical protein